MGNPRPKKALNEIDQDVVAGMRQLLSKNGFKPLGLEGGAAAFAKPGKDQIIIDNQGWTAQNEDGKEMDFGSNARDLARYLMLPPSSFPQFDEVQYIHYPPEDESEPGNYFSVILLDKNKGVFSQLLSEDRIDDVVGPQIAQQMRRGEGQEVRRPNVTGETNPFKSLMVNSEPQPLTPSDEDRKFMKDVGFTAKKKKSYTMTNEGYGTNSKCYKCQQPIEDGQMATWEGGMECHAGGCPRPAPQPQQTPSQRIQNMPQRGKPKTPAQLGLTPKQPEVGYVASLLNKKANPEEMAALLLQNGWKQTGASLYEKDGEQGSILLDNTGWEHQSPYEEGEIFAWGDAGNLQKYLQDLHKDDLPLSDIFDEEMKQGSRKNAVGLQNQGQPDAVCPKCQQPIAEGQMVNYPQGKETHVQCPPATGNQPGQGAPGSGYESRLNLPPGFKRPQPQQQAPAAPQGTPGMISPNVGRPRAGSLLEKKADERFIDDEWRAILHEYGFMPDSNSGIEGDVWLNQEFGLRVVINTDNKGEAFWAVTNEENIPIESGQDTDRLASQLEQVQQTSRPKEDIKWKGDVPQFSESDMDFFKDFKIKGKLVAKVVKGKMGARKPNFGFAVPLKAAGAVAFHLAKAGMTDFEVIHYEEDESSIFAFTNEPSMHLGEEIVRAEFADQIASRKGMWSSWSQSAKQQEDPSLVKSEHELNAPTASDKTADDSPSGPQLVETENEKRDRMIEEDEGRQDRELHENSYYRGKQFSGPQAVPSRYEAALEEALSALDRLAEVGPSDDIKGCAAMSAGDLRQFAKDQAEGNARKFSSEDESPCCCIVGHMKFKGSMQKQAIDANLVTLIGSFVGAVLVKWLGQEYSKRWGTLAKQAEAKAMQALQERGVYDLSTLDKYAEDNGVSRIGAFMRLAGQSMLLAAAMTTGIARAKILSGDVESQTPSQSQMSITDEVDEPAPSQQKNISQPPQPQQDEEVSPQRQTNIV
jgi:hypothetical protein